MTETRIVTSSIFLHMAGLENFNFPLAITTAFVCIFCFVQYKVIDVIIQNLIFLSFLVSIEYWLGSQNYLVDVDRLWSRLLNSDSVHARISNATWMRAHDGAKLTRSNTTCIFKFYWILVGFNGGRYRLKFSLRQYITLQFWCVLDTNIASPKLLKNFFSIDFSLRDIAIKYVRLEFWDKRDSSHDVTIHVLKIWWWIHVSKSYFLSLYLWPCELFTCYLHAVVSLWIMRKILFDMMKSMK